MSEGEQRALDKSGSNVAMHTGDGSFPSLMLTRKRTVSSSSTDQGARHHASVSHAQHGDKPEARRIATSNGGVWVEGVNRLCWAL